MDERDKARALTELRTLAEDAMRSTPASWLRCDPAVVLALIDALDLAGRKLELLATLAKAAQSQAAVPDYDEEAIREALWVLVAAARAGFAPGAFPGAPAGASSPPGTAPESAGNSTGARDRGEAS